MSCEQNKECHARRSNRVQHPEVLSAWESASAVQLFAGWEPGVAAVGWVCTEVTVDETVGFVVLQLRRTGSLDHPLAVHYRTVSRDSAKPGVRYLHKDSYVLLPKGERERRITVRVLDDQSESMQEPIESFGVELYYSLDTSFNDLAELPPIVNPEVHAGATSCNGSAPLDSALDGRRCCYAHSRAATRCARASYRGG